MSSQRTTAPTSLLEGADAVEEQPQLAPSDDETLPSTELPADDLPTTELPSVGTDEGETPAAEEALPEVDPDGND